MQANDDKSLEIMADFQLSNSNLNAEQSKNEAHLEVVLFGIVIVFLVCYSVRLITLLYEAFTANRDLACSKLGYHSIPFWLMITSSVSTFLFVINCSVKGFVYFMVNRQFRTQLLNRFQH